MNIIQEEDQVHFADINADLARLVTSQESSKRVTDSADVNVLKEWVDQIKNSSST